MNVTFFSPGYFDWHMKKSIISLRLKLFLLIPKCLVNKILIAFHERCWLQAYLPSWTRMNLKLSLNLAHSWRILTLFPHLCNTNSSHQSALPSWGSSLLTQFQSASHFSESHVMFSSLWTWKLPTRVSHLLEALHPKWLLWTLDFLVNQPQSQLEGRWSLTTWA